MVVGERPKSRGCGQVTYHQETRDPQLTCIFLLLQILVGIQSIRSRGLWHVVRQ